MQGNQIRPGMVIEYQNAPYYVMEATHRTPGNKRAFMQTKLRNLISGEQAEARFNATEKVEKVHLPEKKMQYLYREGDLFHFMDVESFEQVAISLQQIQDQADYLLPEAVLGVTFYEGRTIGVQLPNTMDFKVIDTEPDLKGATVSARYKPAKLETGLQVKVPPFIAVGDKVRIDTSNGEYVTRVND